MTARRILVTSFLLALIAVPPALASFGGGGASPETPRSQDVPGSGVERTTRQQAAGYYGDAYNDVVRGKKEMAEGKAKNVEKRFRRALERGQRAAEIDSTYPEAWNLVGYCHRQLKEYDKSVAAYQRSLSLKPDYASAREYLGETYIAMGKLDLARQQLALLEENKATEDAATLKAALDAWAAAHPEAAPATQPVAPASQPATESAPAAAADSTAGR